RLHKSQCLSISFWIGHPKVTVLPCLGIISLLLADKHKTLVSDLAQTSDHGLIVLYIMVAVQFQKSIPADGIHIIHGVRSVWMPGQLYPLPCGKVLINVLAGIVQFLLYLLTGFRNINFTLLTDDQTFIQLLLKLFNRKFKI